MRSSDLFLGLLGAMGAFGAVVVVASSGEGSIALVMLAASLVAVLAMLGRAEAAPQVLVVGRRNGHRLNLLESELDSGGFAIATCPGPSESRPCPVTLGRPCPVHAHPSATIAYLEGPGHPVPPCEREFRVPTITLDEGPTVARAGSARQVTWSDGSAAALSAVREVTHR